MVWGRFKRNLENLRTYPTFAELQFQHYLKRVGITFIFQKPIILKSKPGRMIIVDFYLPHFNVVVEVDGDYHYRKAQWDTDVFRDFQLRKKGLKVVRVKNYKLKDEKYLDERLRSVQVSPIGIIAPPGFWDAERIGKV